jgi:hypothetical protein
MKFRDASSNRRWTAASLTVIFSCVAIDASGAQTKSPDSVAVDTRTGILSSPQNQLAMMKLTKDGFGRACLTVNGEARPLLNNLFSHVVIALNKCPFSLRISTCYLGSADCVSVAVPSNGRKELLLGSFPRAKDFRFEFREPS